jgi:hypothetical protein
LIEAFGADDSKSGVIDRKHTSVASDSHQRNRLRLEDRAQLQVVFEGRVERFRNPASGGAHMCRIGTVNG